MRYFFKKAEGGTYQCLDCGEMSNTQEASNTQEKEIGMYYIWDTKTGEKFTVCVDCFKKRFPGIIIPG